MNDDAAPTAPSPPAPPTAQMTAPPPASTPPLPPGYQPVPQAGYPAPPQADAPAKRSRTGLWVGLGVGLGIAGVAVVVALFLFAWSGTSVGASSPQAALDGLVKSLGNRDVAGALASLAPGELTGLDELWRTAQQKTAELATGDTPQVTGDALVFEPRTVKWDVEELSPNTARATLMEIDVTVGFDVSALGLTGDQSAQLEGLDPDRVDGNRYLWELNTDDLPGDGVNVMTVKRDGGWFVSPLYTVGDYSYAESKKAQRRGPPDFAYDPDSVTTGAATASAAVAGLVDAVESGTPTDIVGLLSPRQIAFLQVYRALDDAKATGSDVEIDNVALTEEPLGEGRTRVRVQSADVTWRGGSIEVDGACWTANTDGKVRKGCLTDVLPQGSESLTHLLPTSLSLVAVEHGGKWYVDPLQSTTLMIGDFVASLTAGDTDEIKDLVQEVQEMREDIDY